MPKSTLDIIIEAANTVGHGADPLGYEAFATFAAELHALKAEQEKEAKKIKTNQPQATSKKKKWFEDDLEAALRECGLNQETVDMAYSVVSPLISLAERRGREEERKRIVRKIKELNWETGDAHFKHYHPGCNVAVVDCLLRELDDANGDMSPLVTPSTT